MGRYNDGSGLFSMKEFRNRGAIKLAPDALVYISGNFGTSVISPVSGKTQNADFKDGISSINVQNNMDPPGSSTATIEIVTPIYDERSNYWISFESPDKKTRRIPIFVPMMEVKVFFKGRFLVGDEPKYYPSFWGFVINVSEDFNGGLYKITLQCADMLHWWQYINVAFKPSYASSYIMRQKQGLTPYASRYKEKTPFEIMYALATEMDWSTFSPPDFLGKLTHSRELVSSNFFNYVYGGILEYWKQRFASNATVLKMYGATGNLIKDPRNKKYPSVNQGHQPEVLNDSDPARRSIKSNVYENFGVEDKYTCDFPTFHVFDQMGDIENAEYRTKIEIATNVRDLIEYEFYQDVNGTFIFKPPFYNLDTKDVLPYRISPQDIISFSSNVNSEEIVTALEVQTSMHRAIRSETGVNEVGYHVDLDLVKRFGERYKKICLWYIERGSKMARSIAVGHMSQMNAKAYSGTVVMPGRPEIKLGFPVYIEHKDVYYYIRSISHTFDYGGSFTSTLSLEALRERIYGTVDGQWQPLKNRIYKLTERYLPYQEQINASNLLPATDTRSQETIQSLINNNPNAKLQPAYKQQNMTTSQIVAEQNKDPNVKLEQFYRDNGYIVASEPGRYEIVKDESVKSIIAQGVQVEETKYTDKKAIAVINKTLADAKKNGKTLPAIYENMPGLGIRTISVVSRNDVVPYTDEEGYKVIGSFRYGRGIVLNPNSILDGAEFGMASDMSDKERNAIKENKEIAGMVPASEKEGYEMNAYFSYSLKNNVESVIPSYIELAVQDNGITAIQLANATVTGGVGAVADENLLQNVQLSEYKKTKQRDQDVKKQAALKKTANHK